MYYVYEWYIVESGEVIYVGKGCRNRYKVKKHNKLFNEMIKRFHCESRILKQFNDEKEAFEYEFLRINEMKNIGQCVCNIYNGGFGGSGEWWTEELRKKYSENNVMKSEKQRKRMSDNNPMKDKIIAEKNNRKKRKAVVIGNNEYPSILIACQAYNTTSDVIATWCKKGINRYGEICHYKGQKQIEFTDKRYNKGGSKSVVYKNVTYESIKDFAYDIGISETTANSWLKRGFSPDGIPCRYKDDNREIEFINRYTKRNKDKARTVIINNIEYSSCEMASKQLHIPKSTLYKYLKGTSHNPKYCCEYGNQKPRRRNTDNSTS